MNWRHIKPFLWGATTILGLALLYWVLRRYDLADLSAAIASFPRLNLAAAAFFTVGSFACLSMGEVLGARYAGLRVPPGRNAVVVLAALGIGHSIGLAALSSGAVRLRMYGRSGGRADAVARLLLFAGITVAFGLLLTASWATLVRSDVISDLLSVSAATAIGLLGLLPLALALAYVAACWRYQGATFRLWRFSLPVPPARLAAGQLLAGTANFMCVSAAIYFCLAPFTTASYPAVAAVYVGSNAAGLIGHVPGGWGVLEFGVSSFLPGTRLMAGLLVFRIVYYLVPFLIGICTLLADELHGRVGILGRRSAPLLRPR